MSHRPYFSFWDPDASGADFARRVTVQADARPGRGGRVIVRRGPRHPLANVGARRTCKGISEEALWRMAQEASPCGTPGWLRNVAEAYHEAQARGGRW